MSRKGDDWTDGITVAAIAAQLSPQQAARVKYQVLALRACTDAGSLEYSDRVIGNDPGHRWFCFCLDVTARREVTA
jgi:hypothetical protein